MLSALARKYIDEGDIKRARVVLLGCPEEFRHWEWDRLLFLCHEPVFELTNAPPVRSVHLCAELSLLAVLDQEGHAWTWAMGHGREPRPLGDGVSLIRRMVFSPAHDDCALPRDHVERGGPLGGCFEGRWGFLDVSRAYAPRRV